MKNHTLNLARYCLIFLSILTSTQLFSQKKITGLVTDVAQKETLIGVTVQVKGKTIGTVTDIDGKYSIVVAQNDILVFSYIGMEKQEITVGDQTVINVTLMPISTQLTEVVAIGYGYVKKSDLTGSVAVISNKDLTRNPSTSAAQALQGKAPGVLVTQSGKPGGGASIRVRGVGSISVGADPIFILDGVQVSDINGIQPQDIESTQILKDASATAIYGANGSNGVVIINTKRGKSGKTQVDFNSYIGFELAPTHYNVMNAQQYADFYSQNKYKSYGLGTTYVDSKGQVQTNPAYALTPEFRQKYYGQGWQQGTDWQSQMFKTGMNQNYNLSLAGGTENSNFNISLNYTNEDGNVIRTNATSYGLRANSDFKIGKHIKIGENLSVNYHTGETLLMNQSTMWDLNTSPLMKVYNSAYKGGFESPQTVYWFDTDNNIQQGTPPANSDSRTYQNTLSNDKPNLLVGTLGSNMGYGVGTNASVYLQVDITDWLTYKVTPSAEILYSRSKAWLPLFTGNRTPNVASLTEYYNEGVNLNLENQLTFNKKFNGIHNVQATVVSQVRQQLTNDILGVENGFDFESLNTLSNGGTSSTRLQGTSSDYRMLSYLGRVMYDYKGKYFATASFRSDGVSVFAPTYRRGNFGSGSLAWKINEDFFKNVKDIDALKLRLGYGQTGNSAIGDGFQYLDQIYNSLSFSPVFGDDQHIARAQYIMYGLASTSIHWETAEMFNAGVDLNMFNGKLQTTAEYYIKNNNDLLVQLPISDAFGRVNGNPWYNSGKIRNSGVELSLQWRDNIGKFNYGIISNFTTIKNEVLYLPITDITSGNNRTIVGHSIGDLYGYVSNGIIQLTPSNYAQNSDGTYQKDINGNYIGYKHATYLSTNIPQPGDLMYKDLNGDGNIDANDKTIIGKTIPSFNYTLGFDCSYENFDFNLFLYGVSDFSIYNQQRASLSSMNSQDMDHNKLLDWATSHWTLDNQSTTYVRVDQGNTNGNDQISSFWVEDGSFLRIKDIQLGYTLPSKQAKKIGISSLRIYANASNLYCFTLYKGRDPEGLMSINPLSSGTDAGNYSIPRSFTFGLQVGF